MRIIQLPENRTNLVIPIEFRIKTFSGCNEDELYKLARNTLHVFASSMCEHLVTLTDLAVNEDITKSEYFGMVQILSELSAALIDTVEDLEMEERNNVLNFNKTLEVV